MISAIYALDYFSIWSGYQTSTAIVVMATAIVISRIINPAIEQ